MKTTLKTGFAKIFSRSPKNMGGGARKIGPYAPLNETKKDKLFLKQLRSSYRLG